MNQTYPTFEQPQQVRLVVTEEAQPIMESQAPEVSQPQYQPQPQ